MTYTNAVYMRLQMQPVALLSNHSTLCDDIDDFIAGTKDPSSIADYLPLEFANDTPAGKLPAGSGFYRDAGDIEEKSSGRSATLTSNGAEKLGPGAAVVTKVDDHVLEGSYRIDDGLLSGRFAAKRCLKGEDTIEESNLRSGQQESAILAAAPKS